MGNIWEQVQDLLKAQLGNSSFASWLSPLKFENFENGNLCLSAPNRFIADFCAQNYKDEILSCLNAKFNDIIDVNFSVCAVIKNNNESCPLPEFKPQEKVEESKQENPSWFLQSVLKEEWTFENFVVDETNEFAYKACMKIAQSTDFAYNPVFLYAGIGLGKTHLLHAIANYIAKNEPCRKVLYISARQFANTYVKSIYEKNTTYFKEQFSQYDVLLIDDLQFLDGKKSTQDEFFGILSELTFLGKQVVLAGNRSLSSLTQFDKKLKSCIISGLSLDIARPGYDARLKILEAKQKLFKSFIEAKHLELIARTISSNVRELEGAMRRIVAYQELSGALITEDVIQNVLRDMVTPDNKEINADEIIKKVCNYFDVAVSDVLGAKREKKICYCRQIAMAMVKDLTKHSFPEIGKKFGNKDHTSVMYSCRQIEAKKEYEPRITTDMENIKEALNI